MFRGSIVALATPFKNGNVDYESLEKLVEFHIKKGTDALLPCGCTGEAATLNHQEQKEVIEKTVKFVAGRIPVMAGTGSNSTEEALNLTKFAESIKADAALLITPYYNKPTQEGLFRHYKTIAESVDIPVVLYNVPSRTGINLFPETIARLSEIKNIQAVKEAGGSVDQVSRILSMCDITVLSGDDSLTLPMMSVGAKGVVSVVANILPDKVSDMVKKAQTGDWDQAKKIHYELLPVSKSMFIETNPIPVKTVMSWMGLLSKEWRLPLCEMNPENEKILEAEIKKNKVI